MFSKTGRLFISSKESLFSKVSIFLFTWFQVRTIIEGRSDLPPASHLYLLRSNDNIEENFVLKLGCALGAHAGPGALAVGLQEVDN